MRSALLATMSMIALLSACNGSDGSGPGVTAVGAYTLVSVNGSPVPAVTQNDATIKTEVLSGTLVMGGGYAFTESRQGRITLNGGTPSQITATQSGTWSKSGTRLTFASGTPQNPVGFTGTSVAGTLTYTTAGSTFVYQLLPNCPNC